MEFIIIGKMDCNIFIIEFYNKEGDKKTPFPS